MKNKLIVTSLIVIMLAVLVFVAIQPVQNISDKKEVNVGVILPLSGSFSSFGEAFQQGIEIATDEINENIDVKYKLIFEDDGELDVKKAVDASNKLLNIDDIDVAMVFAVNEGKSISPIFEKAKIPLVVLFDSNKEIEKGDYTFGIGFSTEEAAQTMARHAYNDLNARKIAIVYNFDDWSLLTSNEFKKEFEKLGAEIVGFEGTDIGEKDYRTLIAKYKDSDAIYMPVLLPSTFIIQAKQTGYKGYLLAGDPLDQNQIDASAGSAEGVYSTNVFVQDSNELDKLKELYRKKYRKDTDKLPFVALGYDAMYAIDKAGKTGSISQGLYEIEFEGATGLISFDESGLSPRFERIFQVIDGELVLV